MASSLPHRSAEPFSRPPHGDHIVDGRTGVTPQALVSVTVVHDSLTWADIDATAACALGSEGPAWLQGRPGRCGVVMWADSRTEIHGDRAR
jgi:thiamine biosynthesis lipoprotein